MSDQPNYIYFGVPGEAVKPGRRYHVELEDLFDFVDDARGCRLWIVSANCDAEETHSREWLVIDVTEENR